jgi:hypothetical protein
VRVNICCLCSGKSSEEYRIMGLRYGSTNLSVGATVTPFSANNELPKHAWLVSKMGSLTVGVQYEPLRELVYIVLFLLNRFYASHVETSIYKLCD